MAAPLNPIDVCPRGGFFDGNDDFGGTPFRFLMALLVASPLIYMTGSCGFWIWSEYRRRSMMNSNSSNPNSYRSMDGSTNSLPVSASSSSSSSSSSASSSPSCNEEEPISPITSSSIAPIIDCSSSASSPDPSTLSSSSSSSLSNPFLRARSAHTEYITRLRSIISTMSYRYRVLMMCRLATRPSTLFKVCTCISLLHIFVNMITILYALISKERCCEGGTGALYSILCLRICISYLSIRISHWQTNSEHVYIPVSDKACNIGFSVHMIWISIAFIWAVPGDCSINARMMYGVACYNIVSILIQLIGVILMSISIKYYNLKEDGGGIMTIVCRCILKHLLCGWAYGGALDRPDPATGVEIEIQCLPCIPYGPNVRELVEPLKNMRDEEKEEQMMMKKKKEMDARSLHQCVGVAADVSGSTCDDHKDTDAYSACPNTIVDLNGSDSNNGEVDRSRCEAGLSCAICLNNYELNEMIRPLPCGHRFHKDCTDTWLRVRSTCPLCVRSVLLL